MSFILDALKKSEIERQRQAVPGLMDTRPAAPRPRVPWWAIALAALFAINVAVLAVVWTRGSSSGHAASTSAASATPALPTSAPPDAAASRMPPPVAAATNPPPAMAPPAASSPAAAPRPDHFSPMDAAPPEYAPEIPAAPPQAAPPLQAVPPLVAGGHARSSRAPTADPTLTHEDGTADTEVLPSINEINLNGQLPEMHLDVHVYATKPADRFVYVNMRRYREGETLAEGPVVEHIRRDGVVLAFRGLRFMLPRQ